MSAQRRTRTADLLPLKRNTRFLSRTPSLLPPITVSLPQPDGRPMWGRERGRRRWRELLKYTAHSKTLCFKTAFHLFNLFVCFLDEATFARIFLQNVPQPISIARFCGGWLICVAAVPLKNHYKISHVCILGARRVYHRCPVSSGYTWNIWVKHVDNLSGPPALFPLRL